MSRLEEDPQVTKREIQAELDEALRREASLCDLLNSWARESGVEEGLRQEEAKAVADRLWAHWSGKYHEALAQVAVLLQVIEGALNSEGDIDYWYDLLSRVLMNLPAEARALLDRLQRAEAAVEAGLRHKREVERNSRTHANEPIPPLCHHTDHSGPNEYDASEEDFFKALAAWEERKA